MVNVDEIKSREPACVMEVKSSYKRAVGLPLTIQQLNDGQGKWDEGKRRADGYNFMQMIHIGVISAHAAVSKPVVCMFCCMVNVNGTDILDCMLWKKMSKCDFDLISHYTDLEHLVLSVYATALLNSCVHSFSRTARL